MGIGIVLGILSLIVWLIVKAAKGGTPGALPRGGVRARGLVLQSSQMSTGVTVNGVRYERRAMTIEVEVWGQAPYVTQGTFLLPRGLVEGTPGSSLELSVDPRNPSQPQVMGPGGFTGPWLRQGPPNAY